MPQAALAHLSDGLGCEIAVPMPDLRWRCGLRRTGAVSGWMRWQPRFIGLARLAQDADGRDPGYDLDDERATPRQVCSDAVAQVQGQADDHIGAERHQADDG